MNTDESLSDQPAVHVHSPARHALLLWADDQSTNLGVRVLAEGNRFLVGKLGTFHIDVQSYGTGPSPRPVGLRHLLLAYVGADRSILRWLKNYELVLDTGAGDSFTDIYGLRRLLDMSLLRRLVKRSGATLVLGPQTIGPFETRRGRFLARFSTRGAAAIVARDTTSLEAAGSYGLQRVCLGTDAAFLLPRPDPLPHERAAQDRTLLNVSGLLWEKNAHVDAEGYRESILEIASMLVAVGSRVTLLAHVLDSDDVDNDVRAVRAASALLNQRGIDHDVVIPASLADVRQEILDSRMVISARMHACLNALSMGRPAIALSYSRKFKPLLEDLGWTHHVDLRLSTREVLALTRTHVTTLLASSSSPESTLSLAESRLNDAIASLRKLVTHV